MVFRPRRRHARRHIARVRIGYRVLVDRVLNHNRMILRHVRERVVQRVIRNAHRLTVNLYAHQTVVLIRLVVDRHVRAVRHRHRRVDRTADPVHARRDRVILYPHGIQIKRVSRERAERNHVADMEVDRAVGIVALRPADKRVTGKAEPDLRVARILCGRRSFRKLVGLIAETRVRIIRLIARIVRDGIPLLRPGTDDGHVGIRHGELSVRHRNTRHYPAIKRISAHRRQIVRDGDRIASYIALRRG